MKPLRTAQLSYRTPGERTWAERVWTERAVTAGRELEQALDPGLPRTRMALGYWHALSLKIPVPEHDAQAQARALLARSSPAPSGPATP